MQETPDLNESYDTYKEKIQRVAKYHQHRYGGDLEEILCQANFLFVKAVISHKTEKAPLEAWIYQSIKFGLHTNFRTQARHAKKLSQLRTTLIYENTFNLGLFLSMLNDDARYAVEVALDPPQQIIDIAELHGGRINSFRSSLKLFLKNQGWSKYRMQRVFIEIRESL